MTSKNQKGGPKGSVNYRKLRNFGKITGNITGSINHFQKLPRK